MYVRSSPLRGACSSYLVLLASGCIFAIQLALWSGEDARSLLRYMCLIFCLCHHIYLHFSWLHDMYLAILGSRCALLCFQHAFMCFWIPIMCFPCLLLWILRFLIQYWQQCTFLLRPVFLSLQRLPFPVSLIQCCYPLSLVCNFMEDCQYWVWGYSWWCIHGLHWCNIHINRLCHILCHWRRLHRLHCYY